VLLPALQTVRTLRTSRGERGSAGAVHLQNISSVSTVVVDGDAAARALTTASLRRAGFTTYEAARGEDAAELVRTHGAAVVLLEVALPGASGYEICRELRDEFGEQLPIILVSAERTHELDRSAALLLGADDYLLKPLDADRLLPPVRRLLERSRPTGEPGLTCRELEILSLLVSGHSRKEIARILVITRKTVAKHIEHILAKLDVHSEAQAVATAFRDHLVDVEGRSRIGGRT
jgi:DNA-binding NarL/FixJ family response regulator